MKKSLLAAVLLLFSTASIYAEDGRPSNSKLANLGLSSMTVVSDDAGMQSRGQGLGILSVRFLSIAGTSFSDLSGGVITGPSNPASANLGTVDPATGLSVPVSVSFSSISPGSSLFITSISQGSVFGFAN